jgi:hypothetical protein
VSVRQPPITNTKHFHFDTELNLWMENHVCTHSPTILVFTNACCPLSIVRRDPTIAQITQPLGLWILKRNISTQSYCKTCILCCLQHPKNNYSNICVLKIIPAQSRRMNTIYIMECVCPITTPSQLQTPQACSMGANVDPLSKIGPTDTTNFFFYIERKPWRP